METAAVEGMMKNKKGGAADAQDPKALFDESVKESTRAKSCSICKLGEAAVQYVSMVIEFNDDPRKHRFQKISTRVVLEKLVVFGFAGSKEPLHEHARKCLGRTSWGRR